MTGVPLILGLSSAPTRAELDDPSDRRFTVRDFKASVLSDRDDEEIPLDLMESMREKIRLLRD
jgi:hypothetical protein